MEKQDICSEGKTKVVWSVAGDPGFVIIENKNDITKNNDSFQTEIMIGKAELATITTCIIFQLLKDAGIPVAFERQLGPREFLSPRVRMIPLEIIWRRYAVGSFLKRHPELSVAKGNPPYRFHRSVFELFLKTTEGRAIGINGQTCVMMPTQGRLNTPIVDDPLIKNPYEKNWRLVHPKEPGWSEFSNLGVDVDFDKVLPDGVNVEDVEKLLRRTGLVLEGAWAQLGCRLIDFKIEMGIASDGKLVVADVIDADSWRLRSADWQELSKQLFRDNVDMAQIADKYALVTQLVQQLRIPKQAIVVWRGSKDDPFPEIPVVAGVNVVDIILSGHKSPQQCLRKLEEVLTEYPEGGVILACVGMSNGLGPVLAARTSWPVVGVAMSVNSFPNDIWSSLRMPSYVPMVTVASLKNAVFIALNILGQKNPAAYAERQSSIEKFDD